MYTNIDEMYHAAIKILENRADQLGDDELMHYGKKGMKWYQDIFSKDDESKKRASGGNWGNNALTNAINDPKYNPIKKAQLEKKKQELLEKAKSAKSMKDNKHGNLGFDHDPILDAPSSYTPYISNQISQRTAGGREIVVSNDPENTYYKEREDNYSVPQTNKVYYKPGNPFDGLSGYSTDKSKQEDQKEADRQAQKEDAQKRQEMQEKYDRTRAQREADANGAYQRDYEESLRPIREGKTDRVLKSDPDDNMFPVVPRGNYTRYDHYDQYGIPNDRVSSGVEDLNEMRDRSGYYNDLQKQRKDTLSQNEQRIKQQEAIAKYGNQYPKKTDEQMIAERGRGQFIREEQAAQRKAALDQKKQELLNKAKAERIMRERQENRAKYLR